MYEVKARESVADSDPERQADRTVIHMHEVETTEIETWKREIFVT